MAELLARLMEQPYGSALHELLSVGSKYCGLTYEALQGLVASLQAKVRDLAEVLSLELPQGQTYVDLLLAAHARLAEETLIAAATRPEHEVGELASDLQRELAAAARRRDPAQAKAQRTAAAKSQAIAASSARCTSRAGQGNDLLVRLASTVETARQKRAPVTLALFEVDRFGDILLQLGAGGMTEAMHLLRDAVGDWAGAASQAVQVSDSRVALLSCDCSRRDAVELARQVLTAVKPWSRRQFPLSFELTLSSGVATLEVPSRNFPAGDLLVAAERCLSAAQLSGGSTVKSIDL